MLLAFISSLKTISADVRSRLSHFYRKHFVKQRIMKGEALIVACFTSLQNQPSCQVVVSRLPCKSPVGRTWSLSLASSPDFLPPFFPPGFYRQVFSGLRLTAYISCKRQLSSARFPRIQLYFSANPRLALELQCCTPLVRVMPFNTSLLNSLSQITSCCMYFAEMVLSKPFFAYTLSLLLSSIVKI